MGKKLLFALFGLLVIPLLLGMLMVYNSVEKQVQSMENESVLAKDTVAKELITLKGRITESLLSDNANWTDFCIAVQNNDQDWIKENILSNQKVQFVIVSDLSGKVIGLDRTPKEFQGENLPQSLLQRIQKGEKVFTGLYNTSEGLAIISIGKIFDTDGNGEPTGLLVFGKYLNKKI